MWFTIANCPFDRALQYVRFPFCIAKLSFTVLHLTLAYHKEWIKHHEWIIEQDEWIIVELIRYQLTWIVYQFTWLPCSNVLVCLCVVCAALKELNDYYKHCLSVCKQLHQNGDSVLDSMDSVVQSAALTADQLLYSYAIELVSMSVAANQIENKHR